MEVVGQLNSLQLESHVIDTDIPDNDTARLMYYLYCVFYTIGRTDHPSIQRLVSYQNWDSLSLEERKTLVGLCETFSPALLLNNIFFQHDDLCLNSSHRFYKMCELQSEIKITVSEISVQGQKRTIINAMVFKKEWMEKYYNNPLQRLKSTLYPPAIVTSGNPKKYMCICCICCIVFVILPIIIVIIVDSVQREQTRYNSRPSY